MVPANDGTLSDLIHNSLAHNMVLGERMAGLALDVIYGRRNNAMAPNIRKASRVSGQIVELEFDYVKGRMYTFDVGPHDLPFVIEDQDGTNGIASYEVADPEKIRLNLERELRGSARVHGAASPFPKAIIPIDSDSHLPMLSFYGIDIK